MPHVSTTKLETGIFSDSTEDSVGSAALQASLIESYLQVFREAGDTDVLNVGDALRTTLRRLEKEAETEHIKAAAPGVDFRRRGGRP